ncbi:HD domain-containing protein [Hydrogenispora ethanolica]|jgi:(p)ppGpp synthase/HD superfamily hydrolase|uniref:HD domain-containing protein n=1 Tax=Hydrogenispora ethanolica TaxID=1082276 RepID=A0A4R1S620_HYDET|nr:HD domain-containing protein [Hydrogenispora ethanolica]TCL74230.1 HD domain-containing protein [Hydrogenispora ethanolica]
MYNEALNLAKAAHEGQFDKGGNPYILHPIAVSEMVKTEDEKIVALLHDVVEDTSITLDDLRKRGFSPRIVDAVDAITKRDGVGYEEYIRRVSQNSLARNVKIADMTHNMDLSRIANPSQKDFERIARYEKTLRLLSVKNS